MRQKPQRKFHAGKFAEWKERARQGLARKENPGSTLMGTLIWCLASSLSVLVAPATMAQDRVLAIDYTIKVADIPRELFHVTTNLRNINQPSLDLSLPVWSPGWYVIENYGKNVARLRVTEPGGRELRPVQVRKQT